LNGHIDEFRMAHVQRSDGWIATIWNNMSNPVRSQRQGQEDEPSGARADLVAHGVEVRDVKALPAVYVDPGEAAAASTTHGKIMPSNFPSRKPRPSSQPARRAWIA
jgi:hypothetical protein